MKNIGSIISSPSYKLFHHPEANYGCKCGDKINCLLDTKCITQNVISEAGVTSNNHSETRVYLGLQKQPLNRDIEIMLEIPNMGSIIIVENFLSLPGSF